MVKWNFIIGSIDDDGGNDQPEITVIDKNHVVSDLCHSAPILIFLEEFEFDSDRRSSFIFSSKIINRSERHINA